MDTKIVEFTHLLRANGVRVSLAEVMDALRAVGIIGVDSRDGVRAALRATMVKRTLDIATFDALFDVFFSGLGDAIRAATDAARDALELDDAALQRLIDEIRRLAEELGLELSPLARALLQADAGELERQMGAAAREGNLGGIEHAFQEGRFAHSLAGALGVDGLRRELDGLRGALAAARPDLAEEMGRYLDRRLQDLDELLKAAVRQELDRRDVNRRDRQSLQSLGEKSFFYLTEDEMRRMQEAVAKLAHRLRNVVAIRRRRARRGRFDPSRTIRANLQYGGVPFRVVYDRKRKDKPQIVVLCDVSDSVRNVSRFMLQFVYALQDLYSRVRSFIFVAEIGEVTQLFTEHDAGRALDQALTGGIINVYAHSDFGRAFRSFHSDHIAAINKRTTVIVLGDARNNYNLPHDWVLREVQHRAKQLIWLNPENRMTWGFGDSEMDRYARYCTVVEECRNLNQLYRVIDHLVPT